MATELFAAPSDIDTAVDTSLAELVLRDEPAPTSTPPPPLAAAAEAPGPWFDNSCYDTKLPVREVGVMLHAFEDILWNHSSDLNGIESVALMHVIHRMRLALTELETTVLEPRLVRQQWMPSMGLAAGMKESFARLLSLRNRLRTMPGAAASATIVDDAGKAFAEIMGKLTDQQARAVGIDFKTEQAAAAAAATTTTTPAAAAPGQDRRRRHRRHRTKQNK